MCACCWEREDPAKEDDSDHFPVHSLCVATTAEEADSRSGTAFAVRRGDCQKFWKRERSSSCPPHSSLFAFFFKKKHASFLLLLFKFNIEIQSTFFKKKFKCMPGTPSFDSRRTVNMDPKIESTLEKKNSMYAWYSEL